MQTFIIWTTKKNSYMAPIEKAKLPKSFEHSFEIECDVPICDKKVKLPRKIEKIEHISGLIQNLQRIMNEEELAPFEVSDETVADG